VRDALDALIVGAGVTGLAAAAQLARLGCSVAVVERHPRPGMETSTHNSGVIHAGIYYPPGTLKAALCVDGAARLYAFCAASDVPHERCGKLIVASRDDEAPALEALRARAVENGVAGLDIVDERHIRSREPHIRARWALWSPHTGRIDASALVHALLRAARADGAVFLHNTRILGVDTPQGFVEVHLERETIQARTIVNAAGLHADEVSERFGGERFRIYPCRGEYAALKPARRHLVNGLVYPLPHPSGHGLGVHLTKTTDGAALLGPTIRYQERKDDYESGREPLSAFVESARSILPDLTESDVTYGGTGIRAKLHPPQERFADFMIRRDARQPLLIHAAGMDSPGLTACLAVGSRLADLVRETL
jgi:glycerol-3-phosphate dehydrogenase